MTLLWKRITHTPALYPRRQGVSCVAESNEYESAIAKTQFPSEEESAIRKENRGKTCRVENEDSKNLRGPEVVS